MDATSASEDNKKNTRDELVKCALDHVMSTPGQSYEDFVKGFTFFKTESDSNKKKPGTNVAVREKAINMQKKHMVKMAIIPNNGSTPKREVPLADDHEQIEEEVLEEGSRCNWLNTSKSVRTGTSVKHDLKKQKILQSTQHCTNAEDSTTQLEQALLDIISMSIAFDNFISCDGEDDDSDIPADPDTGLNQDGYTASFLGQDSSSRVLVSMPRTQANREPEIVPDVSELFSGLNVEESQTDKLLMNFLADLQNEMNESQPIKATSAGSSVDIQTFLDKKTHENNDEVNFSDNEGEDVLELCSDSIEKSPRIVVNPEEFSQVNAVTDLKNKEIYKAALMDSEGNMTVSNEVESEASNPGDHLEMRRVVFPGEVTIEEVEGEKTSRTASGANTRLLDFTAVYTEHTPEQCVKQEKTDTSSSTTTSVETFQLDETFDYDHVVLAPKFSMAVLQGRQIQQPAS